MEAFETIRDSAARLHNELVSGGVDALKPMALVEAALSRLVVSKSFGSHREILHSRARERFSMSKAAQSFVRELQTLVSAPYLLAMKSVTSVSTQLHLGATPTISIHRAQLKLRQWDYSGSKIMGFARGASYRQMYLHANFCYLAHWHGSSISRTSSEQGPLRKG